MQCVPMKTVDEPGVEQIVEVEEDVGILVARVELQLEAGYHEAYHEPEDVVDQPGAQVQRVRLSTASLSLRIG